MIAAADIARLREATSEANAFNPIPSSTLLRDPPRREWMVEGCFARGTVGMLSGDGGIGKCVGAGTPILKYDGSVVPVERIVDGDLLMGPDSRPRLVRGTTSGYGPLYRVTPVKGEPYIVNGNHVLSLKMWAKSRQRQFDFPVNLSIGQYLALPKQRRRALMGWRAGVDWPERPVQLSPYLLGLWLGDGTAGFPDITSADGEKTAVPAMAEFAEGKNLWIRSFQREDQGAASTYRLRGPGGRNNPNPFVEALRELGIYNDKQIPGVYLANSERQRLELLAGLIDTDGSLINGCYEITQKRRKLAEQIAFLARSLGFAAYLKTTMKRSQVSELRPYYRVHISGDIARVPVRLKRKRAAARRQKKNVLVTSIKVEPIGEGYYYGFEVDGDHLFLLGDFTVTHNSLLMQQLCTSAALGRPWLDLHVVRGGALFFGCEDDEDELHRRQWSICREMGRDIEDALDGGLNLFGRVGHDNALVRLERRAWKMEPTWLLAKITAFCLEHGISYVVIDTATQTFAGNQNDEQQVVGFINMLRRLAIAIQGVVILTKHPSLSGRSNGTGESGNTAWSNSVRSRLYMYERQDGTTELRGMKANYSRKLGKMMLQWERGIFRLVEREAPRDFSEPQ